MRSLISTAILALASMQVFAGGGGFNPTTPLPEPEVLPLLAVGIAALMVARRGKK